MSKVGEYKEYIPKWTYSKLMHDKYMAELRIKNNKAKVYECEQKPLDMLQKEDIRNGKKLGYTSMNDLLYDNCVITYEKLKERKKNGKV